MSSSPQHGVFIVWLYARIRSFCVQRQFTSLIPKSITVLLVLPSRFSPTSATTASSSRSSRWGESLGTRLSVANLNKHYYSITDLPGQLWRNPVPVTAEQWVGLVHYRFKGRCRKRPCNARAPTNLLKLSWRRNFVLNLLVNQDFTLQINPVGYHMNLGLAWPFSVVCLV